MPSTRTWLVVLASLIGIVVASGVALTLLFSRAEAGGGLPSLSVVMPLRILAMVAIAAAIACVPPLMVRSFVGAQHRIGNRDEPRVAWVARHEAGVVGAMWLVWGAGLGVALPPMIGEMRRAGFTSLVPPADAEFRRRLGVFQVAGGLPWALFPDDLRPDTTVVR